METAANGMAAMAAAGRRLTVTTWNIAAINNNPFEYWITMKENPDYESLMINIENFLETPGANDVVVQKSSLTVCSISSMIRWIRLDGPALGLTGE